MNPDTLVSKRSRAIDASGIRRVFDLGRTLKDPINLSIGQPDFEVPLAVRAAAIDAIEGNLNGYTPTQGVEPLRQRLHRALSEDVGWNTTDASDTGLLVTSGTSGALMLAFQALLDPGDEVIFADPYFVMYPHAATLCGAKPVRCDTYPDFRLTAERVEPLITERTKAVLLNSPGNPTGVIASEDEVRKLHELCAARGIVLISDEIYDLFTYSESRTQQPALAGEPCCPSPARLGGAHESVLLIRGFGKTYGVTGWRMGYAAGPKWLIHEMGKLQQYTYVCAPSIAQWGCLAAIDADMTQQVAEYERRRDLVVDKLSKVTDLAAPGGAFYAFVKIPDKLGLTGAQFVEKCIEKNVLVIPGGVFSARDTHFRLSFATKRSKLEQGLDILARLLAG